MKLLLENWREFINEELEWKPKDSENISQHMELGKEHIIKYIKTLGEKAIASGEQIDNEMLTFYWASFSDEHPEIRDIFAKYSSLFNKNKKESDKKDFEKDFKAAQDELEYNLDSKDQERNSLQKVMQHGLEVMNVISQKQHEFALAMIQNFYDDPAASKAANVKFNNFRNIEKKLDLAIQNGDVEFIDNLYKTFGGDK
jgi:hypothetical protein